MQDRRPFEEMLEQLRTTFSDQEIDRLLRQAMIRQAEGAPLDRDYLLQRVQDLQEASWEDARPIVAELLVVLSHLVASVETVWASLARLEGRVERLETEEFEEGDEWESS